MIEPQKSKIMMCVKPVYVLVYALSLFLLVFSYGTIASAASDQVPVSEFMFIDKYGKYKCIKQSEPDIRVIARTPNVKYKRGLDTEKIHKKMAEFGSPVKSNIVIMGFYTTRDKRLDVSVEVDQIQNDGTGVACLYYKGINVSISVKPKIYLNRDYKHSRCRKEIKDHEVRHSEVHDEVVEKYAALIEAQLKTLTAGVGEVGPVAIADVAAMKEKMDGLVKASVMASLSPMAEEYDARQAQVDSVEEYARVNAICDKYE